MVAHRAYHAPQAASATAAAVGADAWIGDAEGLTPLHYAARHNRWEVRMAGAAHQVDAMRLLWGAWRCAELPPPGQAAPAHNFDHHWSCADTD